MGGFRPAEPTSGPAAVQAAQTGAQLAQVSNTKELGKLLYTQYLFPLEIAAVLLLVAIIAAIALTLRERKDSKHMDAGEQVKVHARDRLQVIKMPPVMPVPAQAAPPGAAAEGAKA
jgi:NADH-quinone oxidoreductase subunit J